MTNPIPPSAEPQGDPAPAPAPAPPPATPPWGADDQFDPAKAWSLIQNLRGDVEKQRARVAELTPYEQKMRELEDAQKSEAQKLSEQLASAQAEATAARTEALRLKVAAAKGVPSALIGRLQGGTEEELAADADALMAAFPQGGTAATHTPVEALRPGALPGGATPDLDALIREAEAKGDVRESIRLKMQRRTQ